ncbi:TIGR00730 family Rossman fold protein [Ferruginibacter lapsinanis]|uniref:LOG family protein n=1 Tax=Ferruginibacter lapsinanis TaxID=563172 RepID=UPI001E3F6CC4|nr:TIGR00730 family Rossman fold protein [Ferruginibacter lapsinanis]UEG48553.1 TIGR00730 family Rossman fold protein [Ferruginibacter lapsinanis]
MQIKSIAVFCGSKAGANPLYTQHAEQLGLLLAEKSIQLIYGGGNKGLMASIANAVLQKEGKVTGIMPEILAQWEHQHDGITELIIVDNMHTRKKMIYEKCDAAVVLAGGFGTLDELFEILTWNQLSIHNKHIFILNTDGFYTHLIAHMQKLFADGFLYESLESRMTILNEPAELVRFLN